MFSYERKTVGIAKTKRFAEEIRSKLIDVILGMSCSRVERGAEILNDRDSVDAEALQSRFRKGLNKREGNANVWTMRLAAAPACYT